MISDVTVPHCVDTDVTITSVMIVFIMRLFHVHVILMNTNMLLSLCIHESVHVSFHVLFS